MTMTHHSPAQMAYNKYQ